MPILTREHLEVIEAASDVARNFDPVCDRAAGMPALSHRLRALMDRPPFPKIVCLCGSTRFYKEFQEANFNETMFGRIVLSVGFYPHSQEAAHGEHVGVTERQKDALDELHKRKIDLADEVLVLNVGGYIGNSTRSEILYAEKTGKPVRYLETAGTK